MADFQCVFRVASREDIEAIVADIRDCDRFECEIVSGEPIEALLSEEKKLPMSYVLQIDGVPAALFGVSIEERMNLIWMIGSNRLNGPLPLKRLLRFARRWVDYFVLKYRVVSNFVHAKNAPALSLLRALGARFSEAIDIGGEKFLPFSLGEK